ncbi:MAG TPA: hypothetical protein DGF10_06570 [Acidimicrobiaceae bacterium]|nr:hypothetical protein [Acidimicrobiaceae bacterium]HCV34314.1 hypothetical protein [Acidimicrobiaceae bacterium]|tara:strand:+ start:3604 stop:4737 length:1134 start_codon:yes stop_codon:yes gene_type:complete
MVLSSFDDYPIHQTPDPIATPASSDKDVYERYWFNGYSTAGDLYFGIGTALYPHLGIRDCGLSLVADGVQHSFHASCRAAGDPADQRVGPFHLEVLEPMRSCRIVLGDNETGTTCDLVYEGRTGNVEEPRHHWGGTIRRTMDTTRFTQLGRWSGWIEFEGRRIEFDPTATWGTKDRSWGIRPLDGGDRRGAPVPPATKSLFFLWAPLNFDDLCVHYQLFEDSEGGPLFSVGALLPTYDRLDDLPGIEDPAARHMRGHEHRLQFDEGSRLAHTADLAFTAVNDGSRHEVHLERIFTFRMKGIGYHHPEWGHGAWKGELAMAVESWNLEDVDDLAFENQHCQHLVTATMGDRVGIGALEQLFVGPYLPYGFDGFIGRSN